MLTEIANKKIMITLTGKVNGCTARETGGGGEE